MTDTTLNPRPSLLIVDDATENIRVLASILGSDYEITFATGGRQALKLVNQHPPQLILLDVVMPEMDGYAVIDALQSDAATRHIPVIFVTAQQDGESETMALRSGAVDFIHKPINPDVVRARVQVHLKLSERERELTELNERYRSLAEEMQQIAIHDGLTQLYNRHYLHQFIQKEEASAKRIGYHLSIAMMDLDHFKRINDLHGRIVGDLVLIQSAQLVLNRLRQSDMAFRFGGEEFLLVFPNTSAQEALTICEDLRHLLQASAIGNMAVGDLTASFGVAQLTPGCQSIDHLINQADQALYRAKEGGRNRVETGLCED